MKALKTYVILFLACLILSCSPKKQDITDNDWTPLFNGVDLTGWDKFLSYQPGSGNEEILGVNIDPDKIMTVVDGMIRIDGRIWGALTSVEDFENYHLRLEFKWGEKRYPPRENELRDSGLLYHCVGSHGAQSGHWMRSHESQIMEENCGDYHSLDGASITVHAEKIEDGENEQLKYSEKALAIENVRRRVIKSETNEKPLGEWNSMELIIHGSDITHIVNGKIVFKASNSSQLVDEETVPLTRGKIQLQSEGAEIFYRNIEIKNLD